MDKTLMDAWAWASRDWTDLEWADWMEQMNKEYSFVGREVITAFAEATKARAAEMRCLV